MRLASTLLACLLSKTAFPSLIPLSSNFIYSVYYYTCAKIFVITSLFNLGHFYEDTLYDDQTIRPFGDTNDATGWCLYKRWADYVSGQELWMWPCQDSALSNWKKAGKYWWSYDENTKQVRSEGSYLQRPTKPFCWFVIRPNSLYAQRLKIKACDETDFTQRFTGWSSFLSSLALRLSFPIFLFARDEFFEKQIEKN